MCMVDGRAWIPPLKQTALRGTETAVLLEQKQTNQWLELFCQTQSRDETSKKESTLQLKQFLPQFPLSFKGILNRTLDKCSFFSTYTKRCHIGWYCVTVLQPFRLLILCFGGRTKRAWLSNSFKWVCHATAKYKCALLFQARYFVFLFLDFGVTLQM